MRNINYCVHKHSRNTAIFWRLCSVFPRDCSHCICRPCSWRRRSWILQMRWESRRGSQHPALLHSLHRPPAPWSDRSARSSVVESWKKKKNKFSFFRPSLWPLTRGKADRPGRAWSGIWSWPSGRPPTPSRLGLSSRKSRRPPAAEGTTLETPGCFSLIHFALHFYTACTMEENQQEGKEECCQCRHLQAEGPSHPCRCQIQLQCKTNPGSMWITLLLFLRSHDSHMTSQLSSAIPWCTLTHSHCSSLFTSRDELFNISSYRSGKVQFLHYLFINRLSCCLFYVMLQWQVHFPSGMNEVDHSLPLKSILEILI